MKPPPRTLVLIGSPRGHRSTSESLGSYFLDCLKDRGWTGESLIVPHLVKTAAGRETLVGSAARADLLVLSFPLYVDCLPTPVIQGLEVLASAAHQADGAPSQRFLAIANCGFPEAAHNRTALAICHQFAFETGREWIGGLAMGMGESVAGRPLAQAGGLVRNVRKAMELTAGEVSAGRPVPEEAERLMERPLMPRWIYLLVGGWGWKHRARRFGAHRRIDARPYERGRS